MFHLELHYFWLHHSDNIVHVKWSGTYYKRTATGNWRYHCQPSSSSLPKWNDKIYHVCLFSRNYSLLKNRKTCHNPKRNIILSNEAFCTNAMMTGNFFSVAVAKQHYKMKGITVNINFITQERYYMEEHHGRHWKQCTAVHSFEILAKLPVTLHTWYMVSKPWLLMLAQLLNWFTISTDWFTD